MDVAYMQMMPEVVAYEVVTCGEVNSYSGPLFSSVSGCRGLFSVAIAVLVSLCDLQVVALGRTSQAYLEIVLTGVH